MSSTLLATAARLHLVLGVSVACLCGLLWGLRGFLSAGCGAALSAGNLWAVRRLAGKAVRAAGSGDSSAAMNALIVSLMVKMIALFALVWFAIRALKVELMPFTLGLLVFVVALVGAGMWQKPGADEPQTSDENKGAS